MSREGLGVIERIRLINVRGLVRVSEIFFIELVSRNEIVCLESEGIILPGLDTKRVSVDISIFRWAPE